MKGTILVVFLMLYAAPRSLEADSPIEPSDVRRAIQRSVPFLTEKGVWWIEEKKCVSCHRVSFLTWSMTDAVKGGVNVDQAKLDEWLDWSLEQSLTKREQDETLNGSTNLDGLSQLILGRNVDHLADERQRAYQSLAELLLQGQAADGSWTAGGQLPAQKRPADETKQVSTMWNALALASLGDVKPGIEAACSNAVQWLSQAQAGKSQEWFVTRYLVEHELGDPERAAYWMQEIRKNQNADGGWPWLLGDTSDALATGQTLYALAVAGCGSEDAVVQRAWRFLVNSQREDGTWPVRGTKSKSRTQVVETSVYWGTAWAVIGLSRTAAE